MSGDEHLKTIERLSKEVGKAEALRREESDRATRLQRTVNEQAEMIEGFQKEVERLQRELQRADQQIQYLQQQQQPKGAKGYQPYAIPGPRLTPRPGKGKGW